MSKLKAMEAKGHEELCKRLFPLLNEFYTVHGKNLRFPMNPGAFYLGNWIADYSQMIDETPIAMVSSVLKSPEKVIAFLKEIKDFFDVLSKQLEEFKKSLALSLLTAPEMLTIPTVLRQIILALIIYQIAEATKEFLQSIVKALTEGIESAETSYKSYQGMLEARTQSSKQAAGKEKFDQATVDKILKILKNKDIKREQVEAFLDRKNFDEACYIYSCNLLSMLVKILGYNKFSAIAEGNKLFLPFKYFDKIFDEMFDRYYPHEHLDRPFDAVKVLNSERKFIKKLKEAKAEDLLSLNRQKMKEIREIQTTSLSEFIDRRIDAANPKNYLYKYLSEYLELGTGKLLESEMFFRSLVLGKPEALNADNFHLELAKLGKTIHVFQDFFAHSNYLEFILCDLKEKPPEDKQRKLYESLGFNEVEKSKIIKSVIELRNETHYNLSPDYKYKDKRVSTGYFAAADASVSIYHAFVGAVFHDEDDYDTDKRFFSAENLDKCLDGILDEFTGKYQTFKKSLKAQENSQKEAVYWLTEDDAQSLIKRLNLECDSNELGLLKNFLNAITAARFTVKKAKDAKAVYEYVKSVVETIRTIIRIVRIIVMYERALGLIIKLLLESFLGKIAGAVAKQILRYVKESVQNWLLKKFENQYLSQNRTGSHSLTAKDESYEKPLLHLLSYEMAHQYDVLIVNSMFFLNFKNLDDESRDSLINQMGEDFTDWDILTELLSSKFLDASQSLTTQWKTTNGGIYQNWYGIKECESDNHFDTYATFLNTKPPKIMLKDYNKAWINLNGEIPQFRKKNIFTIYRIPFQKIEINNRTMFADFADPSKWFERVIRKVQGEIDEKESLSGFAEHLADKLKLVEKEGDEKGIFDTFYINLRFLIDEDKLKERISETKINIDREKRNYLEYARFLSQQ